MMIQWYRKETINIWDQFSDLPGKKELIFFSSFFIQLTFITFALMVPVIKPIITRLKGNQVRVLNISRCCKLC